MKKYVCPICGYVHEGDNPPEKCPQCGCPGAKFIVKEAAGKMAWACEHEVGAAKGLDAEVVKGLEMNFQGECTEVGMYLAMSHQAEREGYPEVAEAYKRYAFEEAEHAAKFAELLGDVLTTSTKKNLELRAAAEQGACAGKLERARRQCSGGLVGSVRVAHVLSALMGVDEAPTVSTTVLNRAKAAIR